MNDRTKKILREVLSGHEPAIDFVETLFDVLHFWDDLIDKDVCVSDSDINEAMWKALIVLPNNPFYRQYYSQLQPLLVNAIVNWQTATEFERADDSNPDKRRLLEIAFVARSDYANILIHCVFIVGGREAVLAAAPYLREHWTEESFDDYCSALQAEQLARQSQE
jgi:hypothetical protein